MCTAMLSDSPGAYGKQSREGPFEGPHGCLRISRGPPHAHAWAHGEPLLFAGCDTHAGSDSGATP